MSYTDLNTIVVDLVALKKNAGTLKRLLAEGSPGLIPVIKSDAYGHGLMETAKALLETGIHGLAISELEEANKLRAAGIDAPLLLISGILPGTEKEAIALEATVSVVRPGDLDRLEKAARETGAGVPVHLKVDTGMGRLGLEPGQVLQAWENRSRWPSLHLQGLFTHLCCADEPEDPMNQIQRMRFEGLIEELKKVGWIPGVVHVANSAGLVNLHWTRTYAARPGIALYGGYPGTESRKRIRLQPVMSFSSRIISTRKVKGGEPIGYGATFWAPGPGRVAVVPVGYDDGYPRGLSNRSQVLVKGKRCPVIGNICMKALMIDITGVDGVQEGEEVVLLGSQGGERITVEELAGLSGTISYELLCMLGSRNRRIFKGQA